MRQRKVTETGHKDLLGIHDHIFQQSPRAAEAYYSQALRIFERFPDDYRTPVLASPELPEYVKALHMGSPFRGYTLWVAFKEDALYLLAAFAPGLPDEYKAERTLFALRSSDTD